MIQLEHHPNPIKHLIILLRHQGRPQTTSPHRKKLKTRKRKSDSTKWKKSIHKHLRNVGKEYFSPTAKKQIAARSLKPHNCTRCKFNCADKVPENI